MNEEKYGYDSIDETEVLEFDTSSITEDFLQTAVAKWEKNNYFKAHSQVRAKHS